jgi:hypothetical protein
MDIDDIYDDPVVEDPKNDTTGDPSKDTDEDGDQKQTDGNSVTDKDTSNSNDDGKGSTDKVESDAEDKDSDKPKDEEEEGSGTEDLSGTERYLSRFGIEAGMIEFDNGESKHFDELDAEKQEEVLAQLHSSNETSIEEKYGLDEKEIGFINYLRENKTSVEEFIQDAAARRVQTILAQQQVGNEDYDKLDEDMIFTAFLKKNNPEATPEEIEEDLKKAKELKGYKTTVNGIREQFKKDQKAEVETLRTKSLQDRQKELEEERKLVVNKVSELNDIDGFQLDDSTKNSVLDLILEVDEDGDSRFLTEVFSDPEKLFRAAWWYQNGSDVMKQREEYWKKEKSAAYKRGQSTKESKKQSFKSNDSDLSNKDKTTPTPGNYDNTYSLDDLY